MKTKDSIALWTAFLLFLSIHPMLSHGAVLDTSFIRQNYLNGEFDGVMDSLEAWRKNGSNGSHSDSVFAYRHLGIVYATIEATRNRSESYLNLLLRLEPETDVLDPFITDSIEVFWEKIKARNLKLSGSQGLKEEAPKGGSTRLEEKERRGFPWVWTAVLTTAAGGAVAFFLLSQDEPRVSGEPKSPDTAIIRIRTTTKP